jgi:hypothetical protein
VDAHQVGELVDQQQAEAAVFGVERRSPPGKGVGGVAGIGGRADQLVGLTPQPRQARAAPPVPTPRGGLRSTRTSSAAVS